MKLYSYYRSSCSYRVRIALHHKNIPYEYIPVHLVKDGGEQNKKDFPNAKNEVPVLADNKLTLSQSLAIFMYLDRVALENPLFPKEFPLFEKSLELMEIVNSGTQPLQNLSVLQKLEKDFKASGEDKKNWVRYYIRKGLLAYAKNLSPKTKFSLGDEATAADMFLIPQMYNAHRFEIDFNGLEQLLEIEKTCLNLEAFKKAHPSVQPDAPEN